MGEKRIDLGLTALDELFMTDAGRQESRLPRIHDIAIELIDDFPDHPFKVRLDEDMDQLVESIKNNGIITPVTLREKPDGRYELISGHRRKKACELAGMKTVKTDAQRVATGREWLNVGGSSLRYSRPQRADRGCCTGANW